MSISAEKQQQGAQRFLRSIDSERAAMPPPIMSSRAVSRPATKKAAVPKRTSPKKSDIGIRVEEGAARGLSGFAWIATYATAITTTIAVIGSGISTTAANWLPGSATVLAISAVFAVGLSKWWGKASDKLNSVSTDAPGTEGYAGSERVWRGVHNASTAASVVAMAGTALGGAAAAFSYLGSSLDASISNYLGDGLTVFAYGLVLSAVTMAIKWVAEKRIDKITDSPLYTFR